MTKKIINRVEKSNLITIDLEDYSPKKEVLVFDLKNFLYNGIILKEKDFRESLKQFDFSSYNLKVSAITCSSDAIIPMWAYMLVASYLNKSSSEIYFGTKKKVINYLFLQNIKSINTDHFKNQKVIVKGCGNLDLSESLYIEIVKKLEPVVSSLMFGEACSSVPVF